MGAAGAESVRVMRTERDEGERTGRDAAVPATLPFFSVRFPGRVPTDCMTDRKDRRGADSQAFLILPVCGAVTNFAYIVTVLLMGMVSGIPHL